MKENKSLKDFLHFYPKIDIVIVEKSTSGRDTTTPAHLEGIDWHLDKVIAERVSWDWDNIKPILRPMSDLNEKDFKQIAKKLLNTEELIFATSDNMWLACSKEHPEQNELEMSDIERIYYAEECNYDNVISMDIKNEKSFAYGCSEDFRFFIGLEKNVIVFQELLKMKFDVFSLIQEGLAIDITSKTFIF